MTLAVTIVRQGDMLLDCYRCGQPVPDLAAHSEQCQWRPCPQLLTGPVR